MRKDVLISIVAPLTGHLTKVDAFLSELHRLLESHYAQYEVILVDSRLNLESTTLACESVAKFKGMRLLSLTGHPEIELMITAGLDSAIGDAVVVLIPGLDPLSEVPGFVNRVLQSEGAVMGVRRHPEGDSWLTRMARQIFYFVCRTFLSISVRPSGSYFIALHRKAVLYLNRTKDRRRFIRILTAEVGLPIDYQNYDSLKGVQFRSFRDSLRLALDVVTASTTSPLRIISSFSLLFGFALVTGALWMTFDSGFSPLVLAQALAAFWCFAGAVVTEYIRHLVLESSQRPLYLVEREVVGQQAIANSEIKNILDSPEI